MSISNMSFLGRIGYLLQRYGTSYLKGAGTTLVTSRLLLLVEKKMDGDANYELVDTMDIGNQLRTVRENDGEGRRG